MQAAAERINEQHPPAFNPTEKRRKKIHQRPVSGGLHAGRNLPAVFFPPEKNLPRPFTLPTVPKAIGKMIFCEKIIHFFDSVIFDIFFRTQALAVESAIHFPFFPKRSITARPSTVRFSSTKESLENVNE